MPGEALEVGRDIAADLQLVIAAAVVAHDLLERLGKAVVDALAGLLVAGGDRIDEADGVADLDRRRHAQAAEEGADVEAGKVGREVGRADAEEVLRDHLREGAAGRAPERIGDGAVEERRSVGGDERIEVERRAARLLLAIDAGVQAERRVEAARRVELDRDRERLPQLVEVLCVRQREVLVEPFRRERLGRDALLRAPVRQRDRGADHRLRRMRHRRDAEPERQPQAHVALVAFDLDELQAGGVVHARASRIPLT